MAQNLPHSIPASNTQYRRTSAFQVRLAQRDTLQRLLAPLPAEQREALLLSKHYSKHYGFPYSEIAGTTGSTEAAVKQKIYCALQALPSIPGDPERE